MRVGHINLAKTCNGAGNNFVGLIESLQRHEVQQYVLVRSSALAKRLALVDGITIGPVVGTAVMAYCLMPTLDLVHVHEPTSARAGLLLTLTRGVPFVLTHHETGQANNRLEQAMYSRAAAIIDDCDADGRRFLRIYKRAVASWHTSNALL